jgi:hypothetical protein
MRRDATGQKHRMGGAQEGGNTTRQATIKLDTTGQEIIRPQQRKEPEHNGRPPATRRGAATSATRRGRVSTGPYGARFFSPKGSPKKGRRFDRNASTPPPPLHPERPAPPGLPGLGGASRGRTLGPYRRSQLPPERLDSWGGGPDRVLGRPETRRGRFPGEPGCSWGSDCRGRASSSASPGSAPVTRGGPGAGGGPNRRGSQGCRDRAWTEEAA